MSDRAQDMLCKAQDMAEHAVKFYDESLAACTSSLGKEVFGMLKKDKEDHQKRIQETYQKLSSGQAMEQACVMPEEEITRGKAAFRELAAKYDEFQSCPSSEADALERALDMETKQVDFYEEQLKDAQDATEKAFVESLLEESRGHQIMLVDLQYYYEDPGAWARQGGLDGA